jgi:hypothetical protein
MQIQVFCIKVNSIAYSSGKAHHHGIMGTAAAPTKRPQRDPSAKAQGRLAEKRPAARRTTVTLSPETLEIVERFQNASGTSTSAAINRIIQRSEPKPSRLKEVNGFLVLDVPADRQAVHFTLEAIKNAEDEMDREYVERLMRRGKNAASKGSGTGRRQ